MPNLATQIKLAAMQVTSQPAQIYPFMNDTTIYFAVAYILGKHGQKDYLKTFSHMQKKTPEETHKSKVSKTASLFSRYIPNT